MQIDAFLEKHIEGYLFHDLENMAKASAFGNGFGACGYPMVASTLAGIELLGGLLSKTLFATGKHDGSTYFNSFWDAHLCAIDPRYSKLGPLVRALVRNGVAHTFVAKAGIVITKGTDHLQTDRRTYLCLDAMQFYSDFRRAHEQRAKPLASAMQANLDEMERLYVDDSTKRLSALSNGAVGPSSSAAPSAPSGAGASGSFHVSVHPVNATTSSFPTPAVIVIGKSK